MSQAPAMPLFTDAYLGDTMHLSLEEHGAYLKILMITWRNNGQPLPDDDTKIARMLSVTPAYWRKKLRPALVGFFDLKDGKFRQKKLEKVWSHTVEKIEKNRDNGKRGGRPKSLKDKQTGKANALPDGFDPLNRTDNRNETHSESIHNQNHNNPPTPPSSNHVDTPVLGGSLGKDVDEIRTHVWRLSGLTEDQIATKLTAASGEGSRHVVSWLRSMPLEQLKDEITDAFVAADQRDQPIRYPWKYLPSVVETAVDDAAKADDDHAERAGAEPWRKRFEGWWRDGRRGGLWLPTWGPPPDDPRTWVPSEVLTEFTASHAAATDRKSFARP